MSALDRATAAFGDLNVKAFLRVIREGESNQTDDAYHLANVGGLIPVPPWVHPWYGKTTTEVGHSTAFGAYQFLGTSYKEAAEALGFGNSATPTNQDLCAVWTIDEKRHALADVMNGNLAAAVTKLADEWVSLSGLGLDRVRRVFAKFGGIEHAAPAPTAPTTTTTPEQPMGALALLQIFGPILQGLIPQIAPLLNPQSDVAKRNVGIAQTVLDTIIQATGTPNLQGAVEKMQADPTVAKAAQQAVVSQPDIMAVLEVGGGVVAARAADLKVIESAQPFWKASAVFWISVLLLPLVYWLVGSIVVGGIAEKLGPDLPVWAKVLLGLFGVGWTGEARSGAFNLVIGLVLGGICGVYYGISVTQQKQQQASAETTQ